MPTLAYGLLALLAREPLTGYEMSRLLRDPIGLFWQARHSQIYPTPRASSRPAGRPRSRHQGRVRDRTSRHAITDIRAGRALRRWVASPPGRRSSRDELLLRVYAPPGSWTRRPSSQFCGKQKRGTQAASGYLCRLDADRGNGMPRASPQGAVSRITRRTSARNRVQHERPPESAGSSAAARGRPRAGPGVR